MARKEMRRVSDRKEAIVEDILAAKVGSEHLASRAQVREFLTQYVANVPVEDLAGREAEIMARIALDHLAFGAVRHKGRAKLRVYNPTVKEHGYESAYTFVEMVNDDMPFLVNSVSAAINRHELSVHITVHPIIRVLRDSKGRIKTICKPGDDKGQPESFIRFAIDREADPKRLKALESEIRSVLSDVRLAVRDWSKMRNKMLESIELLEKGPRRADETLREESGEFLRWLADDHFTFLGYREYKLSSRGDKVVLNPVDGTALGLLSRRNRKGQPMELTSEMKRLQRNRDWLILTKANSRSTVHRNAYLDYVGVKTYDENGDVIGERRFIGLFASAAYIETPSNIPLLRHKIDKIFERARLAPVGHRGKALLHIINTYPRDELFHASVQDLTRTSIGILNLQDRQHIRFFLRRDAFRRFFSCLVYVPKDKYTTRVRREIETILKNAFNGTSVNSSVQISDSALARVHLIVHTPAGDRPRISINAIEEMIVQVVVTWSDQLRDALVEELGRDEGLRLYRKYQNTFPPGYQTEVTPREACSDVGCIEDMRKNELQRTVELYERDGDEPGYLHFMVYSFDEPIVLSQALPVLEDMGVDVYSEHPFELALDSEQSFWIQDFHLRHPGGGQLDRNVVAPRFEECFMKALAGEVESDGLNRLILGAKLNARQTTLLRCYMKYLLQLGMPFSQSYMEDVLGAHPALANLLVEQFEMQFDPTIPGKKRKSGLKDMAQSVKRAVARARNIDEDRILSAFAGAIRATLRTNYFQKNETGGPKSYISIKLDPAGIREMPRPRPRFEIFVYSPEVEGVHLRGGEIARGGLRWSDRREDFRTEILGLMKAQVVKNTVIVPTGAKGGFFPKRVPKGDRDAVLNNGIRCYKTFVRGLLDITDNVVDGAVVKPPNVVRRDGDDPYLVVAADKGTASFSDIANELSAEYGFWLDDAFASGGSAGYDHKKMGITARGAWEAVKRHFREMGVNTQKDPFTVIGVGDMSGDVFGNGMLLSRKIRLLAAFNHLHIFLDPDPDMAASFRERQRLFRKARTGWNDYDEAVISKGGGVFSRQAKTIRLSAEARRMLGTSEITMQPDQLIRAILRMQADLLWNGGIGTYVKASSEGHSDVGDHANDSVRVNADELRCRVIGEGGNLGLTQRARIEFSEHGGRINTDFIDNSGGVDSSDREVNIKILLSDVSKKTGMSRDKRNQLLASMTDEVAELVLRNNYLQTQAISMSEVRSVERIDETARLITNLEKTGLLDRELEFLPDESVIEDRRLRKQGFTRPELAVVLSYAKIDLYNGLIDSGQTLEDFLIVDPLRYFPAVLRRRYGEFIPGHRLSRQILATLIANDLVNRMGPSFVRRIQMDTRTDVVTVARAYTIARQICQAGPLWSTIEELDNELPATVQVTLMFEISRSLRHASYWLIERFGKDLAIEATVERLRDNMAAVYTRTGSIMSKSAQVRHETAAQAFVDMGVPDKLADQMSTLLLTRPALDMADLAASYKPDILELARLYAATNDKLGVYWLHVAAEDLKFDDRWQAVARGNLRDDFFKMRREMAEQVLRRRGRHSVMEALDKWLAARKERVERFRNLVEEMKLRPEIDFATLSVAAQEFRDLIAD